MIPQDFLKAIATEYSVSDTELEVLLLVLNGYSIDNVVTKLDVRPEAVRKRLGEVYKKFHIAGAGPGKLAKLQQILITLYQGQQTENNNNLLSEKVKIEEVVTKPRNDWGQAPDVSIFYGRSEDLVTLSKWIEEENCRVVTILGMGGIGKTALSVKLAQQISSKFESIVWRSLRQSPPVTEILTNLIRFFIHPSHIPHSENIDNKISRLIDYFREHRCLLVLDHTESILQRGEIAGHYQEGYEDYGEFFRRMAEEFHQSCLLITSLENPKELALLTGNTGCVRTKQVRDLLPEDAGKIFKAKGLSEEDKWAKLIKLYRGNPLALKIVATTINELFAGSVSEFLKQRTLVFGDIDSLLEQQLERLSDLEKEILYWFAIERYPISLFQLRGNILSPLSLSELLEALESLGRRSLMEKSVEAGEAVFTLQPVVMEYMTQQLIEQICEEICEIARTQKLDKVRLLRTHALLKAGDDEADIKQLQYDFLLTPVKNRLRKIFRNEKKLEDQLKKIHSMLEGKFPLEVGYGVDNITKLF